MFMQCILFDLVLEPSLFDTEDQANLDKVCQWNRFDHESRIAFIAALIRPTSMGLIANQSFISLRSKNLGSIWVMACQASFYPVSNASRFHPIHTTPLFLPLELA
ncbi:hypothetical protein VNO80_33064 [Phaseolus coccineus]|uniref:Uncharacterized protein n=1 Tax=Phaseolus coccineus TaxID=3886 RepID=A0AAN9KYY9_PHACN